MGEGEGWMWAVTVDSDPSVKNVKSNGGGRRSG